MANPQKQQQLEQEMTTEAVIKDIVARAIEDEDAKVVFVKWHDAVAHAQWHTPDASVSECNTIGYLAGASEHAIEVASTISDSDEINASIVIPIGMIMSVKEVVLDSNAPKAVVH